MGCDSLGVAGCLACDFNQDRVGSLVWANLGFWESGNLGFMKTTLEIPDELYRAVKAKAALEGRRVTDVVIEGLRLVLGKAETVVKRVEFPIIKTSKRTKKMTMADLEKAQEGMDQEDLEKVMKLMKR